MNQAARSDPPQEVDAIDLTTRSPSKYQGGVMSITVTEEDTSATFLVHKHLLRQYSSYFVGILNFKEGKRNTVTLNDVNQDAFRNVVQWIYTGDFEDLGKLDMNRRARIWIQTWAVADRLLMTSCKNMAMDELRKLYVECQCNTSDLIVFAGLGYGPESLLGQYLLDQIAFDHLEDDFSLSNPENVVDLEKLSSRILTALMIKFTERAKQRRNRAWRNSDAGRSPALLEGCTYHDHAEGEECHLTTEE